MPSATRARPICAFALVRVNEHADGIALHGGEADERRILGAAGRPRRDHHGPPRRRPRAPHLDHARAMAGSRSWCRSWSRHPAISAATCRSAALMMVVGAFNQVQSSLRWFVDNSGPDRRLARHAPARRGLSRRLAGGRHDRRGHGSHRASSRSRAEPARARRPRSSRCPMSAQRSTRPGRNDAGRAGTDPRQGRLGQERAVPGARGHVAVGQRDDPAAAARGDVVHAPAALSAARHAARRRQLSCRARRFEEAAVRAALERVDLGHLCPRSTGGALGPGAAARRAAAPGLRPPAAARAALGGRSTTR